MKLEPWKALSTAFGAGIAVVFSLFTAAALSVAALGSQPASVMLKGDRFICSVSPGWKDQTSMLLRIWLTQADSRMHMILPTADGPRETYYTIMDSNEVGIIAAQGSAAVFPGIKTVVDGSIVAIMRSTGVIRWTGTGADADPIEDRIGTCSADLPG